MTTENATLNWRGMADQLTVLWSLKPGAPPLIQRTGPASLVLSEHGSDVVDHHRVQDRVELAVFGEVDDRPLNAKQDHRVLGFGLRAEQRVHRSISVIHADCLSAPRESR